MTLMRDKNAMTLGQQLQTYNRDGNTNNRDTFEVSICDVRVEMTSSVVVWESRV